MIRCCLEISFDGRGHFVGERRSAAAGGSGGGRHHRRRGTGTRRLRRAVVSTRRGGARAGAPQRLESFPGCHRRHQLLSVYRGMSGKGAHVSIAHVVVHTRRDVSDGVQNVFHETFKAVHLFVASFEARVKNPAR